MNIEDWEVFDVRLSTNDGACQRIGRTNWGFDATARIGPAKA